MIDFWRLISFLICLTGFIAVGAALLLRGAPLFTVAVRCALTFIALSIALSILRSLLSVPAGPGRQSGSADAEKQ